jgi:DNA-binding MarR family transcriptional regulator
MSIYGQKILTPLEPRALESHDRRLGFLIYRAGLAVARGYERVLKPMNVMPVEVGVLSSLSYEGPNHVRGLARQLGVGRQTIVNVTKVLENRGWLARSLSEKDARLAIFSVSQAGKAKLAAIETLVHQFDTELAKIAGPENGAVVIETLKAIVASPYFAHED